MSNQFQPLAAGEVVSVQNTYRVSELTTQIRSKLDEALAEWSNEEGVAGEALRFGSSAWQKGKIRLYLSIEFAPDDNSSTTQALNILDREPFHILADGEVVSIQGTYRVSELTAHIRNQLANVLAEWSNEEGIAGEALRFGSSAWQKGKVRLHLTLEFSPEDGSTKTLATPANNSMPATPALGRTTVLPPANNQVKAIDSPSQTFATVKFPKIDSTLEDDHFDLGTMSPVTGEIEMNLSDSEDEQNGYVDFDLSASAPEVNLDELVSRANINKPSLIDEVWNEMSQPNWPGVGRA
jgi:KGK domain